MAGIVYLVDDNVAVLDSLSLLCEAEGLDCQCFSSGEEFLAGYTPDRHACAVLDMQLKGMTGLDLQAQLEQRNSHLPVIFLSAKMSLPLKESALEHGAFDFFIKPVSSELLIERIRLALSQANQTHTAKELAMKSSTSPQQEPHTGKVANDTNKAGQQAPSTLNQGRRTPVSRSDRESQVGGSNQSQTRRGPVGGDHGR